MRAILAFCLLLASAWLATIQSVPAQSLPNPLAPNPLTDVQAGKWPEAMADAQRFSDPIATKLITYYRMLTPNAASAAEIATFMRQNPDWPLPGLLERRRQEAIAAERDNNVVAALCTEKKPTPTPAWGEALFRCADALATIGRGQEAAALARDAWIYAISDPATELAFPRRFPALISAADQWTRFQRLAWNDAAAAQRQIAWLDPVHAAQATGRLALKADMLGYTAPPQNDPGAMLDLARAYRRLRQDQAAVALWLSAGTAAQQIAPEHLDQFWVERQLLTRQLLRDGDPRGASQVIAAHGQTEPGIVVEAEFLAGFIALRKLDDPAEARRHFTALAAASPAVLTQSRAYYWLGRTDAVSGGNAKVDYARAAGFPMTWYGQLAALAGGEADGAIVKSLRAPDTPATALPATPVVSELEHAARELVLWSDPRRARAFLLRMVDLAHTTGEKIAIGDDASAMGMPDIMVIVTRRIGRDGVMPPLQGWPVPVEPPPVIVDPAFSLAIMRQESNFDVGIVSNSGARGLMQLMPPTARLVAKRLGEPTSELLLTTDAGHNMRMGTEYLREMLDKFAGSMPLAAAAYNAGPNRVTQWLGENGDPREAGQSMIDWIEMIPFNETRNYVQRVLENIVVYQARRGGSLPAMMAQWNH